MDSRTSRIINSHRAEIDQAKNSGASVHELAKLFVLLSYRDEQQNGAFTHPEYKIAALEDLERAFRKEFREMIGKDTDIPPFYKLENELFSNRE